MRHFLSGSVLVALVMVTGGTLAQNLGDVQTTVEANAQDGVSSQTRIDALDDQTDELTREYRAALKQLASLREYNSQLEKLIAAQSVRETRRFLKGKFLKVMGKLLTGWSKAARPSGRELLVVWQYAWRCVIRCQNRRPDR